MSDTKTVTPFKPALKPVTHVIFDVDGLLLDTVELYLVSHNKFLKEYGFSVSWVDLMALMGATGGEIAACFVARFSLPLSPALYKEKVGVLFRQNLPKCTLMKGAEKLVRHLHKHKVPIAIASGGAIDTFQMKSTNHREFFTLFLHSVFASSDPEVGKGKPAPDVFLVAANRFEHGIPLPDECLVFEDAPNGVDAAIAAGMQVVAVPDERLDLKVIEKASQILKSLEDFKPENFGLPPYDK